MTKYTNYQEQIEAFVKNLSDSDLISRYAEGNIYQVIKEEIKNRWKESTDLNDDSIMTQKEKIAKALILKFNNEDGRWNYFFRAYDLMSKEPGFRSNLFEENNFQHICWELDNTQKEVRPFAIDVEYTKLPEGHSEIVNQFLQ
jgi:hypothetical protein